MPGCVPGKTLMWGKVPMENTMDFDFLLRMWLCPACRLNAGVASDQTVINDESVHYFRKNLK